MASETIKGHAKKLLVSNVNATATASVGFGVFNVGQFSRVVGVFSTVGSLTFSHKYGPASGSYIVTSTFAANSGTSFFDAVAVGGFFAEFGFSMANSTVYSALIYGEPVR